MKFNLRKALENEVALLGLGYADIEHKARTVYDGRPVDGRRKDIALPISNYGRC